MLTQTQKQILAYLIANPDDSLTIRGLAKKLNKSYTLTYNNIEDLKKKSLIIKQSIPPGQVIKINQFAPKEIIVDIEIIRKNQFLEKYKWIKLMLKDVLESAHPFFILLVFGSYAKDMNKEKSDLDLLVIVKNKEDIMKLEDAFKKTQSMAKLSLNFVESAEFSEMTANPNKFNIGNEAKKNHIILHGAELYYGLVK